MDASPFTQTGAEAADRADVLIVGAGPAGLALATALADLGLQVAVFDQQALGALQAPAEDGREIALTHRARRVMQQLGQWQQLAAEAIAPLREARVHDAGGPRVLRFGHDRPTEAEPLGWLVPNHLIRRAAWQAAALRPGIRVHGDARVTALHVGPQAATLSLHDGRCFEGRLLVAADSRFSATRRLAGIGADMHDYGRSVVVGRVRHEAEHGGVAWECFGYGQTLALLPMNGRCCSAVVTVSADRTADWLALDDSAFAARIQALAGGHIGARIGAVRADGPRHHYPLVGVYARRFVAPRVALIGDAAVGMHPVTAHGWNFGLYGVEVLARELAAVQRHGGDIGALPALQAFEREHRRTTLPVWLGTHAIVSLFTDERALPRRLRQAVLAVSEQAPGLSRLIKAGIERQLTGQWAMPQRPAPIA